MTLIKTFAAATLLASLFVAPAMADTARSGKAEAPTPVAEADKPDNIYELLFGPKTDTVASEKFDTSAPKGGASAALRSRIAAHAKAAGLPAELAEAVVRHESRFNPKARGRHGEIGLMQIKPQTARGLGYSGTAAGLYDVETNLKWGMAYLAGAYKLAGGDTCGTILRYNAGHGATRMNRISRAYCSEVTTYVASL
ncbi:lytic transglycosylase domain-containing protein [Pleomorphomonas sp. JP5]|uniref:lytic transglycosylase domain-containing protein n=1 Tax=Pleomorphomonas sp. JP5 TaxID=2942998 RepID=UPI0020448813|nr:transglycosylase SLT domain-containing protein [Pleomorphomonas sp. JP5]MCM5558559.1 transglycosylase SLT domain-containing protein [Pleomorphomonas sp. JP5]